MAKLYPQYTSEQKKEMRAVDDLFKKKVEMKYDILRNTIKIPPAVNQFNTILPDDLTKEIFDIFSNYKPETRKEKVIRLRDQKGKPLSGKKPIIVKFGLNHLITLIERKMAKLVLIANDVDPIENVVFLPTLCYRMGVPYAIVSNKEKLGSIVNLKTTTSICLCDVTRGDQTKFKEIMKKINEMFIDSYQDSIKTWGGKLSKKLKR